MRTIKLLTMPIIVLALSGCIDRDVGEQVVCGDGMCDVDTENGWCPDCAGLAMAGDGVCEEGDYEWAPECNIEEEEPPVEWCGDGVCSVEERGSCFYDCDFGICGDGICSDDENPWCRVDCGLDPSLCGDGVCEMGEALVCPHDCDDGLCGDGECVGNEATWCEHDCDNVCGDARPVNCGDGCYPEFTDCASDVFECGGREYRCNSADDFANCCFDTFSVCSSFSPDCRADDSANCSYHAFPCS